MHFVWNGLLSLVIGASAASCAGVNPVNTIKDLTASDPAASYLGMSQSEVIACAGQPYSRFPSGNNAETLTYRYSGAGPQPGADTKTWTCAANLLFHEGRLARVSFANKKTGDSAICAFSLPNCRR
jgi:hypothetical protein